MIDCKDNYNKDHDGNTKNDFDDNDSKEKI